MICWSCEKNVEPGLSCPQCKAVLPPEGAADHFAVLGVPRRFTIDHQALESRYRELARTVHPDRFARADPRARRAAMQRTVQINEAWRTLKEPFRRAEYLLSLHGLGIGEDSGRTGSVSAGARREITLPTTFLMEMLERRELLADAHAAGDRTRVAGLARDMRARAEAAMARVADRLDAEEDGRPEVQAVQEVMEEAGRELAMVRYYRRFVEEADALEDRLAMGGGGAREAGAAHAG